MNPVSINYLAVLVCGIIPMIIGALWYGPLFGKAWIKEMGKTEEELKEGFNPLKTYGLSFVAHLFMALSLAYIFSHAGVSNVMESFRISITVAVGFVGVAMFVNNLFGGKSFKLLMINILYNFVVIVVFGVVLALWK